MNHIERFYATIERRPVDRPAAWLGIPDESALPKMYEYFGVDNMKDLKARLGDDIYPVEMPITLLQAMLSMQHSISRSRRVMGLMSIARSRHQVFLKTIQMCLPLICLIGQSLKNT